LYDRAARVLAEAEAAEDDGMAQSAAPRGHVRLTAPMSYGLLHIAPILSEFLERYPAVTIDLHLSDSHVDLLGEGYDAAIRIASLPDSSLIGRTLAPVSRFLVAAPNYLARHGHPTHPLQLSGHRCIAYTSTPGEGTVVVRPVGPLRVNNGDAMLPALIAGLGLGVLPDFLIREALANGRLEIVMPEWTPRGGWVHWLTPPGGRRPKLSALLSDFFHQNLSQRTLQPKRVQDEDGGWRSNGSAFRRIVT
jgi:DNA-binding transcriptional LysR family regulator